MAQRGPAHSIQSTNVADLLERVLDKGVVIAGDIKIKLVDIELLSIQLRLVICSVDKAKEMGMDWWANNADFMSPAKANAIDTTATEVAGDSASKEVKPAALTEKSEREAELEARIAQLEQLIQNQAPAPAPEPIPVENTALKQEQPEPRRFKPNPPSAA